MSIIGPLLEWTPPEDDIYHENHPLHHIVVIEDERMVEFEDYEEEGHKK